MTVDKYIFPHEKNILKYLTNVLWVFWGFLFFREVKMPKLIFLIVTYLSKKFCSIFLVYTLYEWKCTILLGDIVENKWERKIFHYVEIYCGGSTSKFDTLYGTTSKYEKKTQFIIDGCAECEGEMKHK